MHLILHPFMMPLNICLLALVPRSETKEAACYLYNILHIVETEAKATNENDFGSAREKASFIRAPPPGSRLIAPVSNLRHRTSLHQLSP